MFFLMVVWTFVQLLVALVALKWFVVEYRERNLQVSRDTEEFFLDRFLALWLFSTVYGAIAGVVYGAIAGAFNYPNDYYVIFFGKNPWWIVGLSVGLFVAGCMTVLTIVPAVIHGLIKMLGRGIIYLIPDGWRKSRH